MSLAPIKRTESVIIYFEQPFHYFFSESILGTHDKPIRCVEYGDDANVVITGSWDGNIKLWDHRAQSCVGSYSQGDKVAIFSETSAMLIQTC